MIKTEQFNQYTLTDSKFEVIVLSSQMFQGLTVFEGEVSRDPFLTIDAIYINRFYIRPSSRILKNFTTG